MKMGMWTKGLAVMAAAALMAGAAPNVAYAHHGHHAAAPVYADCYQDGVCTGDGCCNADGVCQNGGSCIVAGNQSACTGAGYYLGRGCRSRHHR